MAPAPSVTLIAVARPLSGSARRRNSAGAVETGGVVSAVTLFLTFFPTPAYLRWVEARAASAAG